MLRVSIFVLELGRVHVEEEAMERLWWVGVGCCGIDEGETVVCLVQVRVLESREFLVQL